MAAQQSPRADSATPRRQKAIAATIVGASVVYLAGSLQEQRLEYGSIAVPTGHDIRVEIARTSERRSRGLSGRSQLGADGFLLIWPNAGVHPIWMADMRFALDVVWLDAGHHVLAIESNAQPCAATPCPFIQPQKHGAFGRSPRASPWQRCPLLHWCRRNPGANSSGQRGPNRRSPSDLGAAGPG